MIRNIDFYPRIVLTSHVYVKGNGSYCKVFKIIVHLYCFNVNKVQYMSTKTIFHFYLHIFKLCIETLHTLLHTSTSEMTTISSLICWSDSSSTEAS